MPYIIITHNIVIWGLQDNDNFETMVSMTYQGNPLKT